MTYPEGAVQSHPDGAPLGDIDSVWFRQAGSRLADVEEVPARRRIATILAHGAVADVGRAPREWWSRGVPATPGTRPAATW